MESELPCPGRALEIAFVKALHDWPEGRELESARSLYLVLDSAEDYEVLGYFDRVLRKAGRERRMRNPSLSLEEKLQYTGSLRDKMRDPRRERGVPPYRPDQGFVARLTVAAAPTAVATFLRLPPRTSLRPASSAPSRGRS